MSATRHDLAIPDQHTRPLFTTQRVKAIGGYKLLRDSIPDRFVVAASLLAGYAVACIPGVPRHILAPLLGAYTLSIPLRTYLVHLGWLTNEKTRNVVQGKATVRWPSGSSTKREKGEKTGGQGEEAEEEEGGDEGEQEEMCIILLTARSNAPLGIFDPTFRWVGASFQAMNDALLADPDSGLLNVDPYTGRHRDTANTLLSVYYFRSEAHVVRWARRGLHNSAWMEVARHPDRFTDIELGHELFIAKHGSFEATYLNCEPKGAGGIFERVPRDLGTREAKDAEAVATADVWRSVLRQGKGYGGQSKGQTAS